MSQTPDPLPDPSQPVVESDRLPTPDPLARNTPAAEMARAAAEGLSDHQRKVMVYLAAGNSIAKAARFGHVGRRTVYRWIKQDANFCAVYNAWRRELTESAKTRLLAMADDALDTIHGAILTGHVNASLTVAKSMGLLTKPRIGPDDPERIMRKRRAREMRQTANELRAIDSARDKLPYNHPARHTPEEWARMAENERRREEEANKEREEERERRRRLHEARETRPTAPAAPPPQPQPNPNQRAEQDLGSPEQPQEPQGH
jgi:hypothetical protein